MGCSGDCPKNSIKLESMPQGVHQELIDDLRAYIDHAISLKDRTGKLTRGRCIDLIVDEPNHQNLYEDGNIAIDTVKGLKLIGLNIIESVTLND